VVGKQNDHTIGHVAQSALDMTLEHVELEKLEPAASAVACAAGLAAVDISSTAVQSANECAGRKSLRVPDGEYSNPPERLGWLEIEMSSYLGYFASSLASVSLFGAEEFDKFELVLDLCSK